jgi:hypothetical protein
MSLARTAAILTDKGEVPEQEPVIELLDGENLDGPWEDRVYSSGRGPVRRLSVSRCWISSEARSIGRDHPSESPMRFQPRLGDALIDAAAQVSVGTRG